MQTKVHLDPSLLYSIVTTAAIKGTELESKVVPEDLPYCDPMTHGITNCWLGCKRAWRVGMVTTKLRIMPHNEIDRFGDWVLAKRLTHLPEVKCVVIESDVADQG